MCWKWQQCWWCQVDQNWKWCAQRCSKDSGWMAIPRYPAFYVLESWTVNTTPAMMITLIRTRHSEKEGQLQKTAPDTKKNYQELRSVLVGEDDWGTTDQIFNHHSKAYFFSVVALYCIHFYVKARLPVRGWQAVTNIGFVTPLIVEGRFFKGLLFPFLFINIWEPFFSSIIPTPPSFYFQILNTT